MTPVLAAWISGLGLGASLIIAIGAQNAFVLRQGLKREHVLAVVAVCVLCDWTLIVLGAVGFGSLVSRFPLITAIAAWAGAAFLVVFGALSFRSAAKPGALTAETPAEGGDTGVAGHPRAGGVALATTGAAVGATLAVSLLNPHVYLDTVVLLGSVAAQLEAAPRVAFAAGACTASLLWFALLGFGARLLAPVFERPVAWRVLDIGIGVVMWWIAAGLAWSQLR